MLWMKQRSAVKQWWCRCCSLAPNSRSLEAEFPSLWQKFTDGFWSPSALGMAGQGLCSWSSRDCCCIGSYILTLIAALFSLVQWWGKYWEVLWFKELLHLADEVTFPFPLYYILTDASYKAKAHSSKVPPATSVVSFMYMI